MDRAYYSNSIPSFLRDDERKILGILVDHHSFDLEDLQKNAWISEIKILKKGLKTLRNGHVFFEYTIPRMGKRVDAVILIGGALFVLEFKVGDQQYTSYAIDQVLDYALDLKNFHEKSHDRPIIPFLIATKASPVKNTVVPYDDRVYQPIKANEDNYAGWIRRISKGISADFIDPVAWCNSRYKPTPTIIEAAQALYRNHSVREISRSDAGAINLTQTSEVISRIIEESKLHHHKSICFVTGVPGAGKTLASLNIANERLKVDEDEHAVFLSGNGPLVEVLQAALVRDAAESWQAKIDKTKKRLLPSETRTLIQNIHHFRDEALRSEIAPHEKVVIFDEAQRAWDLKQTSSFMRRKKGIADFSMSEPEFLISVMDRHPDWAVIICLVGGGQEINTGEAGMLEWFAAIRKRYLHWRVYASSRLSDFEYTQGNDYRELIGEQQLEVEEDLHLSVSIRSFRSEKVSELVKALLDCERQKSKALYQEVSANYPIVLTRNIENAKTWLKSKARGTERFGLLASSGGYRLKPFGINVHAKVDGVNWFLNGKRDIRSSYFLEDVATEFDIQGLELDWTCVAWDADLRFQPSGWEYKSFRGTDWQSIHDRTRALYSLNAYRVLLTRARQGMVLFVPNGSQEDHTRLPEYYDATYNYLMEIGFEVI